MTSLREQPYGHVPLRRVSWPRDVSVSFWPAPPRSRLQAPPLGAGARARAYGRGRVGKQRQQAPGGEARAPAPALAPAPTRSARPSHDQGHPHLQQPREAAALQVLSALCEYAPAAEQGEGERRRRAAPSGSSERPPRRRGPPAVRLLAPLAVSSGGGEPLPLPAGRSPAMGEAVSPPQGALPTCPVPQPGPSAPHRGRAGVSCRATTEGSRRRVPIPVPIPAAQAGPGGLLSVIRGQMGHASALILSELSNFGSPHALASLSRVFPHGSIGSPV